MRDAIDMDPYSGDYEKLGTSKAKILCGIIEIESDTTVSKPLLALLNREKKFRILTRIRLSPTVIGIPGKALHSGWQASFTQNYQFSLWPAHDVFRRVRGRGRKLIAKQCGMPKASGITNLMSREEIEQYEDAYNKLRDVEDARVLLGNAE